MTMHLLPDTFVLDNTKTSERLTFNQIDISYKIECHGLIRVFHSLQDALDAKELFDKRYPAVKHKIVLDVKWEMQNDDTENQ